jgi:hypothetical protein
MDTIKFKLNGKHYGEGVETSCEGTRHFITLTTDCMDFKSGDQICVWASEIISQHETF